MLNRPATKIELNIEEESIEYEEMKNLRAQNYVEFERQFQINNILQLLPNYQKEMSLNNSNNIKDKNYNVDEFDPHEFNFSDGKNNIEEFNLNNDSSPKEFNLGDVTIQDKLSNNKSNEKQIPSLKLFSTPESNNN